MLQFVLSEKGAFTRSAPSSENIRSPIEIHLLIRRLYQHRGVRVNPEAYTVEQLRGMMTPGQLKLADRYVARLPRELVIQMADFRTALDLHPETAQQIVEDLEVDAADWGSRSKQYWWITRESIVLLIHKRILGIRSATRRTLLSQARLPFEFEPETTTTKGAGK